MKCSGKIRYWWMWNSRDACLVVTSPSDIIVTTIGFGKDYIGKHISKLVKALKEEGEAFSYEELYELYEESSTTKAKAF